MRAVVLFLALLAGIKVWVSDTVFKSAVEEALVAAYRERAAEVCQRLPQNDARSSVQAALPVDWSRASTASLVIGNRNVPVAFWQVDHPLWAARFKHPYVVLGSGGQRQDTACAYNIAAGAAYLTRM